MDAYDMQVTLKSGNERTRKGAETRERIRTAAIELFAERGYHATSLSDIGERANIQRGALYYHIRAKEELLSELLSDLVCFIRDQARRIADGSSPAIERFRHLIVFQTSAMLDRRNELAIYQRDGAFLTGDRLDNLRRLQGEVEDIWTEVLQEVHDSGELRHVDPVIVKTIILMTNSPYAWFHPGGRLDSREVGELIADLIMHGVVSAELSAPE